MSAEYMHIGSPITNRRPNMVYNAGQALGQSGGRRGLPNYTVCSFDLSLTVSNAGAMARKRAPLPIPCTSVPKN